MACNILSYLSTNCKLLYLFYLKYLLEIKPVIVARDRSCATRMYCFKTLQTPNNITNDLGDLL